MINLRSQILKTEQICFVLKNEYKVVENRLFSKLEENSRLRNIINQQGQDHKQQVEALLSENSFIKDGVIQILKESYPTKEFGSLIHVDVLKELETIIKNKNDLIDDLRADNIKKDDTIEDYKKKENSFDISHLNAHVSELRTTQKKLQDENLNLAQILNKLTEKNTKLKQELILFNNELKKSADIISRKNETIVLEL